MLSEDKIREAIKKAVKTFDVSKLENEALFADAGLDSLDHATILLALDEEYGVVIPDEDFEQCNSIDSILEYAHEMKVRE